MYLLRANSILSLLEEPSSPFLTGRASLSINIFFSKVGNSSIAMPVSKGFYPESGKDNFFSDSVENCLGAVRILPSDKSATGSP